jgi:hypothetical protein
MPARLEIADLVKQRDEVEARHVKAVAELESLETDRAIAKRRECGRLYDDIADLQRRIDALVNAERTT